MKEYYEYKDFEKLHPSTQWVLMCGTTGQPVGSDIYEEAIRENPECFKDVLEHRERWASVPEDVKDNYFKELSEAESKHFGSAPHAGMGMLWYSQHQKEYNEYNNWIEEHREILKKERKLIHDKNLAKYGIEYVY